MYKVIEITKKYRNGSSTFRQVVKEEMDDEAMDDIAASVCENDLSGHNHGYTYYWRICTDRNDILNTVSIRLGYLDAQIINYQAERAMLAKSFPELNDLK